ncbi:MULTISPECIES: ArsC/Spx/MgsR family protein [Methylomonas]|uniref:Nitrogenase-associated protein n=1 Tax=Methylomonas koyamae TaxID=702114 RepID=A0A177NAZ5_9GAMM|nr:ArsC/Spx/MgsR family protein [Methylomonas koyamae]OAI15236.1 nitrogenase-associated protein [Methylomonas koyamae]
MAIVHFYEKPGCLNNTRQKQLLNAAGHVLVVHDLLQHPWAKQPDLLRAFFGEMPVAEWFNRSAPAVKQGLIDPDSLDEAQAIALMVGQPLLIRRPLMEVDGTRVCGFDEAQVDRWLGLKIPSGKDLETCPRQAHAEACKP